MFKQLAKKIFGDPNQRQLDRLTDTVAAINALEPEMQALDDAGLRAITNEIRQRLQSAMAASNEQVQGLESELALETDDDERRVLRRYLDEAMDARDKDERALLDEVLPRAFATVREASRRATGLRPYDEQLIGGLVLHQNRIAEMKTGEGKTLVATLPLYLNALTGRGAHLITPNDYLSKYGVQWMGPVYDLLGLSVGVIQSMGQDPSMASFVFDPDYVSADDRYMHLRPCTRAEAYRADITYGTNNEFGFDYLRDNMVQDASECVQRELYYAIVDEVDNILIDEARTPLIISGQAQEATSDYRRFADLVKTLTPETDYVVDEKQRVVTISEDGIDKVERRLGLTAEQSLYDEAFFELTPYLENALKALALFELDKDYIVRDGEVIIVDEFTGRLMYGRRYSEGLHQAIEAKENVKIQNESLTMATVTFQNFFRMYRRLAGMTGTALTEAEEFDLIYGLEVVVIPTHRPLVRKDHSDVVYKSLKAKFDAVFAEIEDCHKRGQPVLVGTLAIETSEMISKRLKRMGIEHEVLNAKQHEREAHIIAQAGRPGAVTIATNMAGRGVDILLGGNAEGLAREALRRKGHDLQTIEPEIWREALAQAEAECADDRKTVLAAGGLHVLGTERYEARRIDNQLRGRAGRQGDPGSSRFFVALEDDLMRLFGGSTVARLMERLGVDEDVPIDAAVVSKAIASAQIRVEGHNFDMRKHLLEYDDVVNQQRKVIYEQRRTILTEDDLRPIVMDLVSDELADLVALYTQGYEDEWDLETLHTQADRMIHLPEVHKVNDWQGMRPEAITDQLVSLANAVYDRMSEALPPEIRLQLERMTMLRAIDRRWVRHLTALDELREGIGLRAIGQRNPLVEYKREAFDAFEMLLGEIQSDIAKSIFNTSVQVQARAQAPRPVHYSGAGVSTSEPQRPVKQGKKVGRNDPCPCGSGKKFKQCCDREGLTAEEAAAKGAKQLAGR